MTWHSIPFHSTSPHSNTWDYIDCITLHHITWCSLTLHHITSTTLHYIHISYQITPRKRQVALHHTVVTLRCAASNHVQVRYILTLPGIAWLDLTNENSSCHKPRDNYDIPDLHVLTYYIRLLYILCIPDVLYMPCITRVAYITYIAGITYAP